MPALDHGFKAHFFRWEGRLNRKRYIKRALLLNAVTLVLAGIAAALLAALNFDPTLEPWERENDAAGSVILGVMLLTFIPIIISGYMVSIRRLHDLGMSGCWLLAGGIPFLGPAFVLYLLCKKGTAGVNAYGADPLDPARGGCAGEPFAAPAPVEGTVSPAAQAPEDTAVGGTPPVQLPQLFTSAGRLSRSGFALTIGALLGAFAGLTWIGTAIILPLIYLVSTSLFRESTPAFWTLICAAAMCAGAAYTLVLPLFGIPAAVRRLHDMGRSGWWALPVALSGFAVLALSAAFILVFVGLGGLAALSRGQLPPTAVGAIGDPMVFSAYIGIGLLIAAIIVPLLCLYTGWIFFKKGTPAANAYGAPPPEAARPSIRAAYFSAGGTIDRRTFLLRSLILLGVFSAFLYSVADFVISPIGMILAPLGIVPYGAHYYLLLLAAALYPLAALPLVLRRLRTLGDSPYEALFVFASLLPYAIVSIPIAQCIGLTQDPSAIDQDARIGALVTVEPTSTSIIVAAFWLVSGIAAIVTIARLLRK